MRVYWNLTILTVVLFVASALSPAGAQTKVSDYIAYLQAQYADKMDWEVDEAVLIVLDEGGQPQEPDTWPARSFANTITQAICGILSTRPVILEQTSGAWFHRWCADLNYPFARRDTYYYSSGRLTFKKDRSLELHCVNNADSIPYQVEQVVCD